MSQAQVQDIHVKQCPSVFWFYRKEKTRNKKKKKKIENILFEKYYEESNGSNRSIR